MGQVLFYVCVAVWFSFEGYVTYRHSHKNEKRETASKFVMAITFYGGLLGGFLSSAEARQDWLEPFGPVRYAGIALLITGIAVRMIVVRHLGRSFSVDPQVREGQHLETSGLFWFVRHPAYFANVIGYVAAAVCFANPVSSSLVVVLPTLGLLYRIRVEERMLVAHFGDAYRQYQRTTACLLPFVL